MLQCHHTACDCKGERVKEEFFRNRGKEGEQHESAQDAPGFTDRMKKLSVTTSQQEKWKDLTTYDAYERGSGTQWPGIGKLRLSHPGDSPLSHTRLTMQI